jgi:hypothetical protein
MPSSIADEPTAPHDHLDLQPHSESRASGLELLDHDMNTTHTSFPYRSPSPFPPSREPFHSPSSPSSIAVRRNSTADRLKLTPIRLRPPQRLTLHPPLEPFFYDLNRQLRIAGLQLRRVTTRTSTIQGIEGQEEYVLAKAAVETSWVGFDFGFRSSSPGTSDARGSVRKKMRKVEPRVLWRMLDSGAARDGVRNLGMKGKVWEMVNVERRRRDEQVKELVDTGMGVDLNGAMDIEDEGEEGAEGEGEEDESVEDGDDPVERLVSVDEEEETLVRQDTDQGELSSEDDGEDERRRQDPLTPEERAWLDVRFASLPPWPKGSAEGP